MGPSYVLKKLNPPPRTYSHGSPVLESIPLADVSGGQVQIRWAGLAWHWRKAKPNLPIGTKCLVNIARNAKPSLPIQNLPIMLLPVLSNHMNLPIGNPGRRILPFRLCYRWAGSDEVGRFGLYG